MEEKDKGFTLIELLVVIIIIGILSAIAIPIFLNQRKKAVDTAAQADVAAIAKQVATYFVDNDAALTVGNTGGSYTFTSADLTASGESMVVPKSDDGFVAGVTGADASSFHVTITYSGGTKGTDASIAYDAASGLGEIQEGGE